MVKWFVGVDLGGTSIKAAVSDAAGTLKHCESIATDSHRGPDDVIERMIGLIRMLLDRAEAPKAAGIGIGVPGLVDRHTGIVRFLPNLVTHWRDVPLASRVQQALGAPVRLLNDVRTATLGELRFGHGQSKSDITMAFFSIGTGIGGGVVVDGRLRLGPLGAAGELGHQTIEENGPRCGCGNRGCLEALASGTAIAAEGVRLMRSGLAPALHRIVDGDTNRVTTMTMNQVAEEEPLIRETLHRAAAAIGIAAANVVTILHPDLIVLGGGVAELGDLLLDPVREVITSRVGMFPTDDVRVELSQLGEQAGLMGAIALAQEAVGYPLE